MDMESQVASVSASGGVPVGASVNFSVQQSPHHQPRDTLDGTVFPQTTGEGMQQQFREAGYLNVTFKVRPLATAPCRACCPGQTAQHPLP